MCKSCAQALKMFIDGAFFALGAITAVAFMSWLTRGW